MQDMNCNLYMILVQQYNQLSYKATVGREGTFLMGPSMPLKIWGITQLWRLSLYHGVHM